jgi:hypothetical protein
LRVINEADTAAALYTLRRFHFAMAVFALHRALFLVLSGRPPIGPVGRLPVRYWHEKYGPKKRIVARVA